ncbi:MAG: PAS domain S-box protein, partial [Acidobacteria bacterium]|nr:PAS domain S-box protein [Acidobacteriota bacterium]
MRSTGTFSQDDLYPDLHELRRQATELEQRVESLTASEKRYRYLFENARDIVYSLDLSLNLTSINPAVEAILGYSPAEVVGRPVTQFVVPDHRERALEMLARKLAGSSPTEYEIDLAAKDGRRVTVGIRSVLVEEEGRPVGVQGIARDITERKRLEEALRRGDELFQLVVRATSDAVWDWDLAADAVWWDAGLEKFGYQLGRVPATSAWRMERVHPSESQAVAEGLRTALDGDRNLWSAEYRFLRADGTYACVIDRAYLIRDETGTVRRVIGTLLDITEHRRTQEALRESAERFQILFQHHPQPMFVYDRETLRYLEVNEAAVAKYGYSREEFLRMDITGIRPLEEVPRLIEFLASGSVNLHQTGEWVHRTKDGRRLNVEIVGHHLTFGGRPAALVAANDITARKILEEQLQHSQRMEAVGRLAGGIAHDFNNLLTIIAGYCQLLELRIGPGHPLYANFGEIRKAADRAAALTQQLLAFSRRQVIQPRLLDLNSVVAGMDHMLRRLVGDEVALVLRLDPGLGAVNADVVQVEQILLNLAANSRDAMPEGGTLTIATENADVRAASVDGKHRPGRYVRLRVADT